MEIAYFLNLYLIIVGFYCTRLNNNIFNSLAIIYFEVVLFSRERPGHDICISSTLSLSYKMQVIGDVRLVCWQRWSCPVIFWTLTDYLLIVSPGLYLLIISISEPRQNRLLYMHKWMLWKLHSTIAPCLDLWVKTITRTILQPLNIVP